jgi:hypothetical protein
MMVCIAILHHPRTRCRHVVESLDQKYDFELATGHKFFCLNIIQLYLKILNRTFNPY